MRRRDFIAVVGGASAWSLAARAQPPGRVPRITIWMGRVNDAEGERLAAAFRQGLQVLGWGEGGKIQSDYRWVTGEMDRAALARAIVGQQPDVIVVETTAGLAALSSENRTIPIVFVNVSDPAGGGFVATLARPGGTITGFTSNEPTLGSKWPELLKEIAPGVRKVGLLFNPDTAPYAEAFLRLAAPAARSIGLELTAIQARNDAEFKRAIAALGDQPGGGLIVLPEATTNARSSLIIELAARHRLPAIYAYRFQVLSGGLISYGVDLADSFRAAASYAVRIVTGEKPANLPVQAPTRFVLAVNYKTAQALNLTVPTSILLRADEVIE
jgi:putative tryptophan/tyrosine transport system substrate-binding protein